MHTKIYCGKDDSFAHILSDFSFICSGSSLATTSGDTTVKIWNFSQPGCTHTFTDHTLAGNQKFIFKRFYLSAYRI